MAYTNAVFYQSYETGSDAARTALTNCIASNPSGTITSIAKTGHGLVTGAIVDLTNYTAWLNSAWKITVVDANNFTLDGAVWQATADADGTVTPRGGSSKTDAWKTIDGATAARIAPGDTIRIMASPDPTSIGNATWTDGPLAATKNIGSSTNATPIVVTCNAHGYSNGDTVIIYNHSTNTNANGVWTVANVATNTFELKNGDGSNSTGNGVGGATGTVRKFTNAVVTLATACTQNIAGYGNQNIKTAWTASANVTTYAATTFPQYTREGYGAVGFDIAVGFTTGLAAYYTLPSTLDLSGYQQVSFWVRQLAGTIGAAGAVRLRLCTDTAGATPVHDCPIPALGALNQWVPVVVDLGTNLNSSIKSVSLDVVTDNGQQSFLIDNIIACKASSAADSLNLTSLISKNSGSEAWFGIQSINGTRVVLDGTVASVPTNSPQRGYSGTTETVTTYKRETIKTAAAASGGVVQYIQDSGTAGNLITFSGGWNRTDMSTQTGETWFDGQNGLGSGIYDWASRTYVHLDKLNGCRYNVFFNIATASTDISIGSMQMCNTSTTPITSNGSRLTATTLSAVCCGGAITPGTAAVVTTIARADSTTSGNGVNVGAGSWTGTITSASNTAGSGVSAGVAGYIGTISAANGNASYGYTTSSNSICGYVVANNQASNFGINVAATVGSKILGGSTSGNATGIQVTTGTCTLRNFTINESTEVSGFTAYNDGRVYSEKHDGTAGNNQIFCDGGLISTSSAVTHGTASYSWKFSPTSTNRSQYYPLNLPIAQVAVGASALVTVKAWFRRSNTGLTAKLVCKGGQLAGVTSDVTASMTAIADTWEEISISCTPSESGVLEIEAQFWGGTSYNGYVSDLTISQS